MAKKKGRRPGYGTEHRTRPWMPDIPGHQQRGRESEAGRKAREEQTERLRRELVPPGGGGVEKEN
jgi:hypothetical protein